jgi:protein TonB
MSVPAAKNKTRPENRRLLYALLFSLIVHAMLLFFVRVAEPVWQNAMSGNISLSVVLNNVEEASIKPSPVQQAEQKNEGSGKVGMADNAKAPQQALSSTTRTPAREFKTKIAPAFREKEVMTLNKPSRTTIESAPDLLATKTPEVEQQPAEKPFAPAPSIEKQPEAAPSPPQKIVSVAEVKGEKQDKIVMVEAAPAKPIEKEKEAAPPRPVKVEEVKPVKAEVPPPKVEEPRPVKVEEPKPVKVETPPPVKVEPPRPVKPEEPKVAKAEPPPVKVEPQQPAKTEVSPVKTEAPQAAPAESVVRQPSRSPDVFRASPGSSLGLSGLDLSSLRRGAEPERKIKFGERRKTVGIRDQDLRYAMYVESVRLKLERIGQLNYPAAAARENLSGSLTVMITVRSDGSLEDFNILQPSFYEVFNAGSERIVRMSAPFSPFPDNIRQETDVLNIRINWSFSRASQSLE